jgi:hypothetical protein
MHDDGLAKHVGEVFLRHAGELRQRRGVKLNIRVQSPGLEFPMPSKLARHRGGNRIPAQADKSVRLVRPQTRDLEIGLV